MATIYRLDEGATDFPQSEREVLLAFSQLSEDWVVLHSVRWQSMRGGRQGDGEADFVLAHRRLGVIVLEVKGGGIEIQSGQWISVDRHSRVHRIKNPYTQATQSKHALLTFLASVEPTLAQIAVVHAVAFPNVETNANLGPAATPGITLFARDLLDVESALLRIFDYWGAARTFSSNQLSRIVSLLAPTVTVERTLSTDVRRTESQILHLTESQQRGFSRLRGIARLLVLGGPGTGKTLLAVERARLLAEHGASVLMACYNDLLSHAIGTQLKGSHNVHVATFHRFCASKLREAGNPTPTMPSQTWWDLDGPNTLRDILARGKNKFDALIVDEGQDFSPLWFDALMRGLSDPEQGQVYVFADDRQELWRRDWRSGLRNFGEFQLLENCRNSASIAKCVNAIYGDGPPPLAADGAPVVVVRYGPHDDLTSFVIELGERLMFDQEIEPSDLTILVDNPRLADRLRNAYVGTTPVVGFGGSGVVCETVARFKGLESAVVLLVLSRGSGEAGMQVANAYIGLSRARAAVVVLLPDAHPAAIAISESAGRK